MSSDQSRARDVPAVREERVLACMALMPHSWERGKTAKRLATEWGCSLAVVEQASAEAWRRLKATDPAWVKPLLGAAMATSLDEADDIEDPRARIAARCEVVKTWGPLVGANAPSEQKVTVHAGEPEWVTRDVAAAAGGDEEARARVVAWVRGEVADAPPGEDT